MEEPVSNNKWDGVLNEIYDLADGSFSKMGWSLNLYLRSASQFIDHLNMHHTIEERFWFPYLAKRMPQFSHKDRGEHVVSHEGIHHGLDELDALVKKYKKNNSSYSPAEMRACLDGFREVLFKHLDKEVHDLKGSNLKKFWKYEELRPLRAY
ncbi:hypothetical protein BD626DRAFT_390831 [Schizophyllum amplum]|uniref:Hemerythrin-like domain-containing protein n=1 Tax=Schizophyllum amplum TaxID=97359 RepID=A0A550CYJ0_9AGAR|nr:hypothetical protein BD626DRAFT_390831 [Auriculariopsis ampla]